MGQIFDFVRQGLQRCLIWIHFEPISFYWPICHALCGLRTRVLPDNGIARLSDVDKDVTMTIFEQIGPNLQFFEIKKKMRLGQKWSNEILKIVLIWSHVCLIWHSCNNCPEAAWLHVNVVYVMVPAWGAGWTWCLFNVELQCVWWWKRDLDLGTSIKSSFLFIPFTQMDSWYMDTSRSMCDTIGLDMD